MQYKSQYGTIFAVKEHNGAPAIMCRAEHSETWSLSSMIDPYTPGAWTAGELQSHLDNWAATKGWKPVDESPACLCVNCTCTGCHEECFGHCKGCGHPVDHCNSYQTEGKKGLRQNKEATPCNTEPTAPTGAAAATTDARAAPEPPQAAETTTTSESGAGASKSSSRSAPEDTSAQSPKAADAVPSTRTTARAASGNGLLPAFDYAGLNVVTVDTLHLAENIIRSARQKYIVDLAGAVDMAHEELVRNSDGHNQHTEETFVAWCRSVGISKTTAYQLLQVQALITGATPEEQAVLEAASPSLLYAAAKPSAPAELVQAVRDGDITTHKQYQALLAQYDAEKAARAKAEKDNDVLRADSAKARDAARTYHRQYEEAAAQRNALLDQQGENISLRMDAEKERDTALRRAAEAEKQRDGARDALAAAKLRGDKLKAENDALKAHPIEAQVVDEEEINRRAQARADELTAPLREELEALRSRHPADPEEAEQAMRDAYDSTLYTGRAIENAWRTLRPLLSCLDAARREQALRQLNKTISQIQGEIVQCL